MSRRAKILRRLVPTLALLVGCVAAAASAIGSGSSATAAKPTAVVKTVSHTKRPPAPRPVVINSETTETQNVDTHVSSIVQMVAAMATVNEQAPAAPAPDISSSSSSADEVPAADPPAPSDPPAGEPPSSDVPISVSDSDDADGDGCSDSYDGACVEPYTGVDDVNCADVTETDFDSLGDDPYRLDSDDDGVACESI